MEKIYLLMYELKHQDGTIDCCCKALLTKECVQKAKKSLRRIYGKDLRLLTVKHSYLQVCENPLL